VPRTRALPPVDETLAALREAGVNDAPQDGPAESADPASPRPRGPDEESLKGLLDLALFVAEHRKRVSFPGFTWDDPFFVSEDAKLRMRVAYVRLPDAAAFVDTVRAHLPRAGQGPSLLAVDAHATDLREFDAVHDLYGRVTLFEYRTHVPEPADPRVDAARERGWAKTLKEHNLLPGRGLVVLDEHQGLFLREEAFARLMGIMLLLPSGNTLLLWNPFVEPDRNDSENQYWLGWGEGSGRSSEWRELVRYEGDGAD
jgi:hypothetical protein